MLERDFDQYVRDRFEDHSSDLPADMWQRISGEKEKNRKEFFLWKWYFLAAALMTLFLIVGQRIIHRSPAAVSNAVIPVPSGNSTPSAARAAVSPVPAATPTMPATTIPEPANRTIYLPPKSNRLPKPATQQTLPTTRPSGPTILPPRTTGKPYADPDAATQPSAPPDQFSATELPHKPSDRPLPPLPDFNNSSNPISKQLSCPDPNKSFIKTNGWYLEALASPDYIFSIRQKGGIADIRAGLSYTTGIRLTKVFNSGFLTTVGLQYSRINLRNEYDSAFSLLHGFNNLDLPLLIGYENSGDRFKFAFRGGAIVNLHSWPIVPGIYGPYYRTNTGISLYLGMNFAQQINERLTLFAEPYYRYQLSNMLNPPLSEKIDVGGLFIGIRYTLKQNER